MRIGILGGGLTGIELGRCLKAKGEDFVILEKNSQIGGLCRTFRIKDWLWDLGVHAIYSRNEKVMEYFHSLPIDYESRNREVKIFYHKRGGKVHILDYPFENGIRNLPFKDKMKCINGYISVKLQNKKEVKNLEEWINNKLGYGIAKHFMNPYNNKIWNAQLKDISIKLVANRIEPIPIIAFMLSLIKKTIGRTYQAKFIYPTNGIQVLVDTIAQGLESKIKLNAEVKRIKQEGNKWLIIYGENNIEKVDRIVSTIPLVDFLKMIEIKGLEKKYNTLKYNDTYFVMIGFRSSSNFKMLRNCHWVFFPGKEIFYRVTFMHNFSSRFLPTVVVEITNKGKIQDKSEEEIKNRVLEDFIKLNIIESVKDISVVSVHFERCTYPIPTVGLDELKNRIKKKLEENKIYLLGRTGSWDYINMDDVVQKVWEFVEAKNDFSNRSNWLYR